MDARDRYPIAEKELIDYISSILLSKKQELKGKVEGMKLNERKTASWEYEGTTFAVSSFEEKMAYNQALMDVINLLT